jgi:hypothetical protein
LVGKLAGLNCRDVWVEIKGFEGEGNEDNLSGGAGCLWVNHAGGGSSRRIR